MHSLITLISILLPLFVGFFLSLPHRYILWVNTLLDILVYVILFLIGLSLSKVNSLIAQLGQIFQTVSILFCCIIVCNLLFLVLYDRFFPMSRSVNAPEKKQSVSLTGGFKQLAYVLFGLLVGYGLEVPWLTSHYIDQMSHYALMLLVLLVGIQLRSGGIRLHQVLINRRGVLTGFIFIVSCLLAGVFFSLLTPEVSLAQGLALSSGYGWYSLSGIVMTQSYGAIWGSVALINDLARELFAVVFIPILMRRNPSAAVGIGGATSLDFTLPIIRSSGGVSVVPMAISFGFIVNIVAPALMVFFSNVHF